MALTDPTTPEGMALQGDLFRPLRGDEMQQPNVQLAGGSAVLRKAQRRLRELQAGGPPPEKPSVTTTDALPADPEYQAKLQAMRSPYLTKPNVTEAEADAVQARMAQPTEVGDDGLLSDFRAVGSMGDDKIPDEGRVRSSIEAISSTFSGSIDEAKRGEITQTATRDLADLLGMNPKRLANNILGRQRGDVIQSEAGLAETMLASRDLLMREMDTLDKLAAKAEMGSDEDALKFRGQLELVAQLQAQIKGAQTEIARALSSFRIPARMGATGQDPVMRMADMTTILEEYGGANDIRDMAKMYNQTSSVHARSRFARGVSRLRGREIADAVYEVWINGLLSSPVTHAKNVIGAFLTTVAHVPETMVAGAIGGARRAMGGQGGVYMSDAQAQVFGAVMSLRDAWGAAANGMASGDLRGTKIDATTSLRGGQGRRPEHAFSKEAFGAQGVTGQTIDMLGHVLTLNRVPTRALEFEDAFFKVTAQRMSLYEQAMRSGNNKGLKGDALAEHIAQFVYNPPAGAMKQANAHAKYVTLQTDLDAVGKNIAGIRKVPTLRYFLPFFKTPYNAFKYALVDRGPIGIAYGESAAAIRRANAPGATRADKAAGDMAMARLAMGNGTAALIFAMTKSGEITGKGPADNGLRDSMMRSGWRPYSVRIGNTYYSYQAAEPFSSTISMAADAAEAMFYGGVTADDNEEIYAAVAAVIGNQLTNKTFMQGFSNLVKTLNDPVRYGESTADSFIRSLTPRFVAQGEKMVDPINRAAREKIDLFRAQVPGLSDELPARRNFWGQTIYIDEAIGPDIVSPIYAGKFGPNQMDPDPARAKLAFELDQEFDFIKWGPSRHPKTFMAGKEFGPKGLAQFHTYAGMYALQELSKVVGTRQYQRLRDAAMNEDGDIVDRFARDEAILMLKSATLRARQMAKAAMLQDPKFGPQLKKMMEEEMKKQRLDANNLMDILR